MEFGTAPQPQGSPEIDDFARREASSRMHTVMPAHESVTPDELTDEQVVTFHAVQPAVANVANDTELTEGDQSVNIVPDKSHRVALTASISISLLLTAVVTYIFLLLI